MGEIEYENFNAAGAEALFHGRNIHPGSAKNAMVNSQYIAMEFQSLLPTHQRPEATEGYEGFFHLMDMKGEVELTRLRYIIRDHDMGKFEAKKAVMTAAADFLNAKYGAGTVELTIRDSYFNMKKCIEPVMYVVERAKKAMAAVPQVGLVRAIFHKVPNQEALKRRDGRAHHATYGSDNFSDTCNRMNHNCNQ